MTEFKTQAIDKILDAYNDDLQPLIDRLKEMKKLSDEYNTFSGIAEGVEGEVKFIYETDSVKVKSDDE